MRARFKGKLYMNLLETTSRNTSSVLDDILVLSVRKSFWASSECEIFPNRIYAKIFFGYSQNLVNSFFVALKGLIYILVRRPKLIFFGSVPRIVPWFINLKRIGLLPKIKLVATNQIFFNDNQARYLEKIIIYSRAEIKLHRPDLSDKYEFMPLPADGEFERVNLSCGSDGYIFSGGGDRRDFSSLIEAVQGLNVNLKIVTFSRRYLGYKKKLPTNCDIYWRVPLSKFIEIMARSLFVVVPLKETVVPHGHTTIVQAMRLGKAIISTRNASVEDYIIEGENGFLVPAGNVQGYRQKIHKLLRDEKLRSSMEQVAKVKAKEYTYDGFSGSIVFLCQQLLSS